MVRQRRFVIALSITAAVVVSAGWMSGLRMSMHAVFLAFALVAFLPFVIILGLLLAVFVAIAIAAFFTAGHLDAGIGLDLGDAVISGGNRFLVGPYYRFLARRRHPVFWGLAGGWLMGALLLLALVGVLILPGELRTGRILVEVRDKIERRKNFPRSLAECGAPTIDGFGRPLQYDVAGHWILGSYRVSSPGFDGIPGTEDDLCIGGQTKTLAWASIVGELLRQNDHPSLANQLAVVNALKCE